ncbi:fatty acid desaturase [Virgifigura deserti]|uniref:fatty acid desaturase n=1 Tax=Virgifigura deserti TaxID=2268457 RepID=UPI003CCC371A
MAGRSWRQIVVPYAKPDTRRGIIQLLNTGLPFLATMGVMLYGLDRGIEAALLLAPVAAALLVRLFAIQHDCGHGSFFASRWANNLLGRVLGVFTLTPYAFWRRRHAVHHATSGNLDQRGVGDVTTVTLREYLSFPARRRLLYRLYRHPLVMFGVGPAYQFVIRHRVPTGHPLRHWQEWSSVLGTNGAIAALVVLAAVTVGLKPLLLGYLPVILLAASIGVWLFYVQHQFEDAYWESRPRWNFQAAALEGCSFYDLPRALHWITGHIGFHHIHHLSSKIPNYRLRECFEQNPEFQEAKRLTLWDSLKCPRLALWDEERRKLVPFRSLRQA